MFQTSSGHIIRYLKKEHWFNILMHPLLYSIHPSTVFHLAELVLDRTSLRGGVPDAS